MTDGAAAPEWHSELNARERRFVEEYLVDLNGKQAAIRSGLSKKTATHAASRLLAKPSVRRAVGKLFDSIGISSIRILEEQARIAFANVVDYVQIVEDKNGDQSVVITPTDQLSREQLAAVSEISETVNEAGFRVIKVKFCDKQAALAFLGKVARLGVERVEVTGKNGGPVQIEDSKALLEQMIEGMAKKAAAEDKPKEPNDEKS